MRKIRFTKVLTAVDLLDVTLHIEKKEVRKFALNYRAWIKDECIPVYRVDNFHGFLHEQRFWRDKRPIRLEEDMPLKEVVRKYTRYIILNFEKFKSYYEK
ncbi:MAG: hypothetical protein KJ709_00155 [Nanoarchaeota archaeon]|nr:hypothetical protein [Nanoarchaeota archaeon]